MSVLIKGFPMPNNCGACPLRLAWCRERIYMVTRPERCPLVPVPPHGKLIDADANLSVMRQVMDKPYIDHGKIDTAMLKACIKMFEEAPTIIEAEEGE